MWRKVLDIIYYCIPKALCCTQNIFNICSAELSCWVTVQSMRSRQRAPEGLTVCRPAAKRGHSHPFFTSCSPLGLPFLKLWLSLSPFLLHQISQKSFQNSSHNYHEATVNSLQFPRAHYRSFLKTAVYWPFATQLWCDGIWGAQPVCKAL